jgi:hypothetical protein
LKLSVVIPTRERADLLDKCLETCALQEYEGVEFLVSDNMSADHTRDVVAKFQRRDARVRYVNPGSRLGMSEHWQFALSRAIGDYIMVIGDDDGLLPRGLSRVAALAAEFPEAETIFSPFHVFHYPSLPDPSTRGRWTACGGPYVQLRSSRDRLIGYINGWISYAELPGIYYGFVRRDLVAAAMQFGIRGLAPDVFLASYFAARTEKYLHTPSAFALAGVSSSSNGFAALHRKRDQSRAGLLRKESAIEIIEPIKCLSIPADASIALLQIDSLMKLKEGGLLPGGVRVDWGNHVANVRRELRAKIDNNPGDVAAELAELESALADRDATRSPEGGRGKQPAESLCRGVSDVWARGTYKTGRAPRRISDIQLGSALLARMVSDREARCSRFLVNFVPRIEGVYLNASPSRLVIELAYALRIIGCDLIYFCSADDTESGITALGLSAARRKRFQHILAHALQYYFDEVNGDIWATEVLERIRSPAQLADEDVKDRLATLMKATSPSIHRSRICRRSMDIVARTSFWSPVTAFAAVLPK